jgi:hypothetical protein
MNTNTKHVKGNNFPTYFLGRPRAQYENRFHTSHVEQVASVHRIFSVDRFATVTETLAA